MKECRIVCERINADEGNFNYYLQFNDGSGWKNSVMFKATECMITHSILWELKGLVALGYQFIGVVGASSLGYFETWED